MFFTDSKGRIDYVADNGTSATISYGPIVAGGTTSLNPVIVDNGSEISTPPSTPTAQTPLLCRPPRAWPVPFRSPSAPAIRRIRGHMGWSLTMRGTPERRVPLLYVVGTGGGTTPTLYSVGFNGSGLMNGTTTGTAALTSAAGADASPLTEYFNPRWRKTTFLLESRTTVQRRRAVELPGVLCGWTLRRAFQPSLPPPRHSPPRAVRPASRLITTTLL